MKSKSKFNMQGILFSAGGGVASAVLSDVLAQKVKLFQEKPNLLPFVPAIGGCALAYFGDDNLKPAGYGMIGYAGAQLGEGIMAKMDGFSRIDVGEVGLDDSDFSRIEDELDMAEAVDPEDINGFNEFEDLSDDDDDEETDDYS